MTAMVVAQASSRAELLRARFEDEGFRFEVSPSSDMLPAFMDGYRPDAIATRGSEKVAIALLDATENSPNISLVDIRRLFVDHPEWRFRVVNMGVYAKQHTKIARSVPKAIRDRIAATRTLGDQQERQLAFLSAWSLLEAAYRSTADEPDSDPYEPGTVVQTVAMNGAIDPETERSLRELLPLRNRVAHGDLDAQPTIDQVNLVLSAVDDVLDNMPSPAA